MATKDELAKAAEQVKADPMSRESWPAALELATDWLAEHDPTPLTVESLTEMHADIRKYTASFGKELCLIRTLGDAWWFEGFGGRAIYTVGELRTLARLAGVELKERSG